MNKQYKVILINFKQDNGLIKFSCRVTTVLQETLMPCIKGNSPTWANEL